MNIFRKVMVASAVLCLLPLVAVLISATFAAVFGCELNEGVQQTCSFFGLDIGGALQSLFVMGWMALMTLPLLLGIVVFWGIVEALSYWRMRRRMRVESPLPDA